MLVAAILAVSSSVVNPCALLETGEIARVLGWAVIAQPMRSYQLPGGAGKLCAFDGRDGTVIVTIPSKGTGIPVNDATSDLGTSRTPMHDAFGFNAPVELGRDSAIVHTGGRDYGITVAPLDAQFADEAQMRALATALIRHLPRRRAAIKRSP